MTSKLSAAAVMAAPYEQGVLMIQEPERTELLEAAKAAAVDGFWAMPEPILFEDPGYRLMHAKRAEQAARGR